MATAYSELGRQRFAKLYNAASSGAPGPPADLRYLKQTMSVKPQHAELRGEVIGFLHQIYTSIAETLPDVRDGALEEEEVETGCSIQLIHADPYAAAVSDQKRQVLPEVDKTKDKKSAKGKAKPRKMQRSIPIRPERTVHHGLEERYLPPGTMKEYWIQYTRQSKAPKPASFPMFWRVPRLLMDFIAQFFLPGFFEVFVCQRILSKLE